MSVKRSTQVLLVSAVQILAGCSGASVTESIQPVLEFSLQGAAEGNEFEPPTIISSTPELAVLEGSLSAPNPCYEFDARVEVEEDALKITVTGTQVGGMCIQVLGAFSYQARISGLTSGTYPVLMIHEYPGTGWETKRYELTLTVP